MKNEIQKTEYNPPKSDQHSDNVVSLKMYAELERKLCPRCETEKPRDAFTRSNTRKTGLQVYCRACESEKRKEIRKKYPERAKARDLRTDLMRNYGISVDQYEKMRSDQNGCCACCGKHETEFQRRLNVDHDHNTGAIRALLCNECNPGIGYFQDSFERLEMAIRYLKKFKN